MEQARPAVGPKAELRPREAGSISEEQAAMATENSYLMSAAHQKDQNARIENAAGKGDLALIGMQQSKDHVETVLRQVTAQCDEMYKRDIFREGELERFYQQMRKAISEDGGRWPTRKDFETDSDHEEACRMHFYALQKQEAPEAPAQVACTLISNSRGFGLFTFEGSS